MGCSIQFNAVSRQYAEHQVQALSGVSLSIPAGQFVALMGASGCGKSTLLHLLGGLDKPSAGEIRVDDQVLNTLNETALTQYRRDQVGFVFQFFNLLPTLTVLENILLPLQLNKGYAPKPAQAQASALLASLGLEARQAFYPSQLSGGQMQRVAIARALIHRPPLLLADEPTGNLDTANGQAVLELLKTLCQAQGITLVMATHAPEAAAYADRIIKLQDGQVVSNDA
ncbi:MAG: ABC transporter ATP-binding protein [Vampirovibrionales bacterium]|nr:ABC transporter ATP-binding protein [Vampirovibrionales bacterium]